MIYRCGNDHHARRMYLEVGLEDHSDDHLPVPFVVGTCATCSEPITHNDWNLDEQINPPRTLDDLGVPDAPFFAVPGKRKRRQMGDHACGIPMNQPKEWTR